MPFLDIERKDDSYSSWPSQYTHRGRVEELEQAYFPFTGLHGVQVAQTVDQTANSTGDKESKGSLRSKEFQVIYRWSKKSTEGRQEKGGKISLQPEDGLGSFLYPCWSVLKKAVSRRGSARRSSVPHREPRTNAMEPGVGQKMGRKTDNAAKAQMIRRDTSIKWLMVRQLWLWKFDESGLS